MAVSIRRVDYPEASDTYIYGINDASELTGVAITDFADTGEGLRAARVTNVDWKGGATRMQLGLSLMTFFPHFFTSVRTGREARINCGV